MAGWQFSPQQRCGEVKGGAAGPGQITQPSQDTRPTELPSCPPPSIPGALSSLSLPAFSPLPLSLPAHPQTAPQQRDRILLPCGDGPYGLTDTDELTDPLLSILPAHGRPWLLRNTLELLGRQVLKGIPISPSGGDGGLSRNCISGFPRGLGR